MSFVSPDCGSCNFIFDKDRLKEAAGVVFYANLERGSLPAKRKGQTFVWWTQESPNIHSFTAGMKAYFDWTMTYHHGADIYSPYGSFAWVLSHLKTGGRNFRALAQMKGVEMKDENKIAAEIGAIPADANFQQYKNLAQPQLEKFVRGKRRNAVWLGSDCTSLRRDLVIHMKHLGLPADLFGKCSGEAFPVTSKWDPSFFRYLSIYKFYLSFESELHCREYITQNLWNNALYSGAVPVIWGPHKDEIRELLPPKSYIHVEDFPNTVQLVLHLQYLSRNASAYAEYLQWRTWTKYLDENGRYLPRNVDLLPLEAQPTSDEKRLLEKFALREPLGFCRLCRRLHGLPSPGEGRKKAKVKERLECIDEKVAIDMTHKLKFS